MTTQLQQEIDRWEAQLEDIAETGRSDNWFLEERRLTEAQQTIITYRSRILPLLAKPDDRFIATEIEHLVDRLEDLRNDLFRTVHPVTSHEEIAETIAALRALVQVALHLEPAS
ncbi:MULTISPECIES: hypothetical protein [Kribbella]|uniref:Uncharacterized protein n=1 Tax=Kribbella karoonensis TaxID=324851 RepID=A0ABP4Q5H6_9ACTN